MDNKNLILLVDDDRMNLKRAQEILQGDEYTIAATLSGEQAISFIEKKTPDLILMDVNMPGLDGFETVAAIRNMPNGLNVPVIFLTAQDDVETEIHGFEMGAEDFIRKPFVSSIVKKRVERTIESAHLRNSLEDEVKRQTDKAELRQKQFEQLSIDIIGTLATTIDAKDAYTKGHSSRVSEYSIELAKCLGWSKHRLDDLRIMALLHDVGKIGIPDRVLNKPGRLTDEEFGIIKSHTIYGDTILNGVSSLKGISDVARHHHERFDGRGYPDKISGEDISIEARIVGIADAYDAMSSDRVYRKALPKEIIREELVKGRGTQFDPNLLDVFLELFDAGKVDPTAEFANKSRDSIDISNALEEMLADGKYTADGVISSDEFKAIYEHIKNTEKLQAKVKCAALITLECDLSSIETDQLRKAMAAMEYSVLQSLKATDMTGRVSEHQQIVVFTEDEHTLAGEILDRVFAGYYKNCLSTDIKPSYSIEF